MGERWRENKQKAKEEWERAKANVEEEKRKAKADEEKKDREERDFWEEQARKKKSRPNSYRRGGGDAPGSDAPRGGRGEEEARPPPKRKQRSQTREAYLELLGFPRSADPTEEELKKAYRAMAMQWHPDRPHNRERAAEATEMFQACKEAYEYFLEGHRRASARR